MNIGSVHFKTYFSCLLILIIFQFQYLFGQTDQVVPPATIIAEGLPPIPKLLEDDFKQSTKRKMASFIGWTTNGSAVGYTQYYEPFVQNSPTAPRKDFEIALDDPDNIRLQPGGEKSFLFTKDKEGDELTQLFKYEFETNQTTQLTKSPEITSVNSFLWSEDGKFIYFLDRKKQNNSAEIYIENPQNKEIRKLLSLNGDAHYIVAVNDSHLIYANYLSNSHIEYCLLNLANLEVTKLTNEIAYVTDAKLSKSNNGIFWLSDKEGDFLSLYFYDLKSKTTNKVNTSNGNITGFCFSPDEKSLAIKVNEAGADSLIIFGMNGAKIDQEILKPNLTVGVLDRLAWRNNEELGFSFESQKNPTEIRTLNIRTKNITLWAKGEAYKEFVDQLQDTTIIKWKSFDGRQITGLMLSPNIKDPSKKFPVIIDIHGGPKEQYQPYFNSYRLYAARMGVTLIFPNIRGSSGFGKEFENLDNKEKRVDALKDLESLLDWISNQPQLDANKIIAKGTSYGGFMALALGLKEPNRLKGVIAEVPPVSIKNYLGRSAKSLQTINEWEYGNISNEKSMSVNESLSLLTPKNLDNWKLPVLLTAGKNDARVSVEDIEKLKDQLKNKGNQVWYLKATNEGHFWSDYDNNIFLELSKILFVINTLR